MFAHNLRPTSHIYTILTSHYFSLSPPDLPAIDSLWASILNTTIKTPLPSTLDPIFYDRLIEQYADIDEVEKALYFLRRMPQEGKSPGWAPLLKVLQALVRVGEWEAVRELVHDVKDEENGLLRHGQGLFRGKRDFWEEVDMLGERGVLVDERATDTVGEG